MTGDAGKAVRHLDRLYEFEREPVTRNKLLGFGSFAGSFAGEHVAATEFVIGVLFVSWGATIRDVFVGLAIGNLLAVLTWTLLCAPIAVRTRLTLYWYLRRIGGPWLTVVYNLLNAVLFCVLAGCMITVSASAVRIPFGIPPQTQWYPTDLRFVMVVLGVGGVVTLLAILGFKRLSSFAGVCSPWIFSMFLGGALIVLPRLGEESGMRIDGVASFFAMAEKVVWTGRTPDGSEPMGFTRVAAFAWICNLAMHGGLSDMALLRYAKRASYGLASVFGMFLGHYLAWICAGIMGAGAALLLSRPLTELDAGEVAFQALGWSGAIAVILAGWTTSNPTLYRAGLALQAVTPNWSRTRVTLAVGAVTTGIACFPFVFTKLLDFVGIYGLVLSPAGAIVVCEHWIFPRLGLTRYWASRRGLLLNVPALIAWIAGGGLAGLLIWSEGLHLFYLFLPVYLVTLVVYLLVVWVSGLATSVPAAGEDTGDETEDVASTGDAGARPASNLVRTLRLVAVLSLVACVALPLVVALEGGETYLEAAASTKGLLLLPTLLYFLTATLSHVARTSRG